MYLYVNNLCVIDWVIDWVPEMNAVNKAYVYVLFLLPNDVIKTSFFVNDIYERSKMLKPPK